MLLKKAHVKDFRCIENSEEFKLDNVTCLVGKNESGKTAILKALYRIKPDKDKEKYSMVLDYPKKKWVINMAIPKEPAIKTEWELDDKEITEIEDLLGQGVLKGRTIIIKNGYDNNRKIEIEYNENRLVENLITKHQITFDDGTKITSLENLTSYISGIQTRSTNQNELLSILTTTYKDGIEKRIANILDAMIPTFLYFDQYTRLPGNISINEIVNKIAQNTTDDNDKIFMALLSLAGTDVKTITEIKTFEEFNSTLRTVSNQISAQIFGYWTQNQYLDVDLKLDYAKPGDTAPFNSGYVFRTRINNTRHKVDTSFDERSSGFVWFFSFLIWFKQLKQRLNKKLIILLDEPGLTLHARAQGDLLRYINEQLKPDYQVVYTTHSPFMIDTDNILSARTVEDVVHKDKKTGKEEFLGTKVSDRVLSIDPDTVSPLQRALDYEITQSLFVGKNNILVEGPSDYIYLKYFSQKLIENGKNGLNYKWTISIVNGIDKIPGYLSLFGANLLHVSALIDVQNGQKQKIDNIRKAMKENHLLLVSSYVDPKKDECDIEDVLGNEFYIALINEAYRLTGTYKIDESKIRKSTTRRILQEVQEYFATLPPFINEYDHYFPAEYLYSIEDPSILPGYETALKDMEKLINDFNKLIE